MIHAEKVIVIDLDGTLCNCDHRVELAQAKDWEGFHAGIPDDTPMPDVSFLLDLAGSVLVEVVVITGRNETYRKATLDWLSKHGLDDFIDVLLMRPDRDRTRDGELKLRLIDEHFGSRLEALRKVAFILEDRDQVVEAYRGAGFHCWQVKNGGY